MNTGQHTVRTVCSYCATGCGIVLTVEDDRIMHLEGAPEHPTNHGMLCAKGRTLKDTIGGAGRALHPLMRTDLKADLQRVTWDAALDESARRFAAVIREHGPRAVGFYVSGQLLTEDYYVYNKLMKGFIGSNNIDSNSRLCMSSAVAGYKRAFGVDGPPTCYEDIDLADNIFVFGANPAFAHPILFGRMQAAREEKGNRIVVIDPRRTDTCNIADLHLPIHPGSDVALMMAMLNVLIFEGLVDEDFMANHTNGAEETLRQAKAMTLRQASDLCGVPAGDIVKAALWFGEGKTLSLWTMGLNQSIAGVDKNNALINLHLATGNIGKPGCGPFSLTGQPNAMGGRESGSLANLLPGHRDLANEAHRQEMAAFWGGVPIDPQPGLTATEMIDALDEGTLKAVWIVCTNPAVSLPDTLKVRRALAKADWVMISDAYHPTDTTQLAHVVLPASGWAEKEGSMTNAERRISRVRKAIPAAGESLPDWEIATRFAHALGDALGRDFRKHFPYRCAEDVWNEHVRTTTGRDCDITELTYSVLERGPKQWPYREGAGAARLYTDFKFETPDGRARFLPVTYRPVACPTTKEFPLSLTTGRVRDQWHTMTKTGRVPALNVHAPVPMLLMNPTDAKARDLEAGELVDVRSALSTVTVPIVVTTDMRPGVVFLPMHWGAMTARAGEVNQLIAPEIDPISKQPEFKHCPVQVERSLLRWRGIIVFQGDQTELGRSFLSSYPYGTTVVQGAASRPVTTIEFGGLLEDPLGAARTADIKLEGVTAPFDAMEYNDRKRNYFKRVWIQGNKLAAVRWIGFDLEGIGNLKNLMLSGGEFKDRSQLFA
jgi:assimilatory nitrate reductase catalytic subunit